MYVVIRSLTHSLTPIHSLPRSTSLSLSASLLPRMHRCTYIALPSPHRTPPLHSSRTAPTSCSLGPRGSSAVSRKRRSFRLASFYWRTGKRPSSWKCVRRPWFEGEALVSPSHSLTRSPIYPTHSLTRSPILSPPYPLVDTLTPRFSKRLERVATEDASSPSTSLASPLVPVPGAGEPLRKPVTSSRNVLMAIAESAGRAPLVAVKKNKNNNNNNNNMVAAAKGNTGGPSAVAATPVAASPADASATAACAMANRRDAGAPPPHASAATAAAKSPATLMASLPQTIPGLEELESELCVMAANAVCNTPPFLKTSPSWTFPKLPVLAWRRRSPCSILPTMVIECTACDAWDSVATTPKPKPTPHHTAPHHIDRRLSVPCVANNEMLPVVVSHPYQTWEFLPRTLSTVSSDQRQLPKQSIGKEAGGHSCLTTSHHPWTTTRHRRRRPRPPRPRRP